MHEALIQIKWIKSSKLELNKTKGKEPKKKYNKHRTNSLQTHQSIKHKTLNGK